MAKIFSGVESKWILESEYPFSRVIKLYDTVSINTETENRVIVFGGRIDNSLQSGTIIAQFDGTWSQLGIDLRICTLPFEREIWTILDHLRFPETTQRWTFSNNARRRSLNHWWIFEWSKSTSN